jgi:cell division protease FtsH
MDEKHNYHREYLLDNIAILMGGRVAEELVLGHMSTGAGNDLERATDLARKMVCEWGMSEKLGPVTFGKREEMIFLGKEIAQHQDYSEQTAQEIDQEVRRFVIEAYERAKELVKARIGALHALAASLLEREVLEGPEVDVIITGAPA